MTFSFMLNTAELTALECPWNTFTEWMGGVRKSHNLVVSSYEIQLVFIIVVDRYNMWHLHKFNDMKVWVMTSYFLDPILLCINNGKMQTRDIEQ